MEAEKIARSLLRYEAGQAASVSDGREKHVYIYEKLRGPLGGLMGPNGYSALLARALALAQARNPGLNSLRVREPGVLAPADESSSGPAATAAGHAAIVAELLRLLITFIGKDLTLRLLRDIWPGMKQMDSEE